MMIYIDADACPVTRIAENIARKHFVRRLHSKACHDMVIRCSLVHRQLLPTIRQREHAHLLVKPLLINAVLTFHFPVMPRCCDSNTVVFNPHLHQSLLKQCFVL